MTLIVQKYGGSSVGTPERIRAVAARVARARSRGDDLVVVVSAMGDTTDDLLGLAAAVTEDARRNHPRELDMLLTAGERIAMALLAMAIRDAGAHAVSLTGSQAAIITDEAHTGARIEEIRVDRIRGEIAKGRVVIVAGFQGVSRTSKEVTTLGRGGSDTTAVALAAALQAPRCEIYTDVDGVYTADPRRVPAARRIEHIDYGEMLELAQSGAQVMHPRAVEIGARYGVPIRVLSSLDETGGGGTLIATRTRGMEEPAVTGIAAEGGYARLVLRGLPRGIDTTAGVLGRLADAGVSVDMVALGETDDAARSLQLTVREEDLQRAEALCRELIHEHGGAGLEVKPGLAKISLVGIGMHGRPGVYALAFRTLRDAGVEAYAISTSSMSISLLVQSGDADEAQRRLHAAFALAAEGGVA